MFRYFTIKFHFSFFASFRFKFFASLRFSNFCFEAKQSKIQVYYFAFFITLKFSLRSDLVIFASKRNEGENFFASKEAKFNIFGMWKKTIFVSLQFFRLIFACFTFVFSTDFWCFAAKWIMWNKAFFRFQAKQNFRFNFKFRFQSESEGAPYMGQLYTSDNYNTFAKHPVTAVI